MNNVWNDVGWKLSWKLAGFSATFGFAGDTIGRSDFTVCESGVLENTEPKIDFGWGSLFDDIDEDVTESKIDFGFICFSETLADAVLLSSAAGGLGATTGDIFLSSDLGFAIEDRLFGSSSFLSKWMTYIFVFLII